MLTVGDVRSSPVLPLSCSQLFGEPDADNDVSPETEEGEEEGGLSD